MLNLKNNFILAPVKTGYGDSEGNITQKHLNFYLRRSKYIGAITPEPLYLDKSLRELPTQIGIGSDNHIAGLQKLVKEIHKNDTKVIAHLNHPGRMVNPKIPGNIFLSSTDKSCENGGATPKRMDKLDMTDVIDLFKNAAIKAEKAGFDFIELQFGHGYLLAQFISPAVNDRTDEYGGSFENRIKFPLEVLETVKQSVSIPVIARVSGEEMTPNGFKLDEMIQFTMILKEKGVEAIHVSAGTVCNTPPWFFQHMFVPKGKTWEFAKKLKHEVEIPTTFVGQINTFDDLNNLKDNFKADYISVGRALVADPDFIGKYLNQVDGLPKPCLACSDGCLGGVKSGKGLGCVVNPLVGTEEKEIEPANEKLKIAVVGGGLAGSEASITLKKRGHNVTLFEKNKIGGQFDLAYLPPKKDSLKKLVDYYDQALIENNIKIIYKEAKADDLKDFDKVIVATGSVPAYPPIKNLKEFYWAEILKDENLPENKTILVIGGGLIGSEIAHKLEVKGNKVILVEMLEEIARGMETIEKVMTLKSLNASEKVKIYTKTRVTEIDGSKVYIETESGKEILEEVDIIVLSTGMKSFNPFEGTEIESKSILVGDVNIVGKAQDAIKDAYEKTVIL